MILREYTAEERTPAVMDQGGSTSFFDLLILMARHKKFIVRFTLIVTLVGAVAIFLVPNRYTAETVVLPPTQSTSMAAALASQLSGSSSLASLAGGSLGIKNPGDMYVALFHSRTVEDAVIGRFHLMSRYHKKRMVDTRKKLESRVSIELGSKDGLIRIEATDWDPKMAAELANGYVEEFRKLSESMAITEASQRRLFFQRQLLEAKDNLAAAEEAMKRTEQTTGVLQIDSQAKSLIETASVLQGQIVAKEVQIQGMRSFATDDNPELVIARQQLAALQSQLAKLAGDEADANSLVVPKGKVPEAGMEYIRQFRNLKYNESVYEILAKQFEIAKLDEARQGAIVQVADIAVAPDKKSFPSRSLIIAAIFLGALILACVIIMIRESVSDVETASRLQTLWLLLGSKG